MLRALSERTSILLILMTLAGCTGAQSGAPRTQPTDATAIAAQSIIDSALQETSTPAPPSLDVTPSLTASVAPAPTSALTPTATPDHVATSTAQAHAIETAIAATLTTQPTSTPDHVATSTAQAHAIETAIAATLTAQPTSTPNLAATQSVQAAAMQTAIAATLTAQPTSTATHTATPTATRPATPTPQRSRERVIGASVSGQPIEAVEIGSGNRRIIFVGGLHAGSAPSTVALARQAADYFRAHPQEVPLGVTLGIVLNANPDAPRAPGKLEGRLNAAGVDLNRNWDCEWQAQAKWRDHAVSGGDAPFSAPETQALLGYITGGGAVAVIFWEAKMETGQVSAGGCGERSLVSQPLAELYGGATGYTVDPWAWYPVNGDAANSLDRRGIPAASVVLRDYEDADWSFNLRGILAVLETYGR
jgi:hypothetical protein